MKFYKNFERDYIIYLKYKEKELNKQVEIE